MPRGRPKQSDEEKERKLKEKRERYNEQRKIARAQAAADKAAAQLKAAGYSVTHEQPSSSTAQILPFPSPQEPPMPPPTTAAPMPPMMPPSAPIPTTTATAFDELSVPVSPDQQYSKIPQPREAVPPPPPVVSDDNARKMDTGAPMLTTPSMPSPEEIAQHVAGATPEELAELVLDVADRVVALGASFYLKDKYGKCLKEVQLPADEKRRAVASVGRAMAYNAVQISPNTEAIICLATMYGGRFAAMFEARKSQRDQEEKDALHAAQIAEMQRRQEEIYERTKKVMDAYDATKAENEKLKSQIISLESRLKAFEEKSQAAA